MTTDREALRELLAEVDDSVRAHEPEYDGALADAADRARAHLDRPDPCTAEVDRASAAAYAAGQARNAGAEP